MQFTQHSSTYTVLQSRAYHFLFFSFHPPLNDCYELWKYFSVFKRLVPFTITVLGSYLTTAFWFLLIWWLDCFCVYACMYVKCFQVLSDIIWKNVVFMNGIVTVQEMRRTLFTLIVYTGNCKSWTIQWSFNLEALQFVNNCLEKNEDECWWNENQSWVFRKHERCGGCAYARLSLLWLYLCHTNAQLPTVPGRLSRKCLFKWWFRCLPWAS